MTQLNNEYFKEFSQPWRELAARVQPPLMDKELIDMFMGIFHFHYMENMVGSNFPLFSNVVTADERIESHVKKGKVPCATNASGGGEKTYSNFPKNKEGEANVVMRARNNRA